MSHRILEVEDLTTEFETRAGRVVAVNGVTFGLDRGEILGLVGESGSGKTTAGTALLAYSRRGAYIEHGTVMFEGQDVLALPWEQIREIRGMKIAYVPQDPAAALNPAIRIGRQIVELGRNISSSRRGPLHG